MRSQDQHDHYEREMGRPPRRLPDDHPDAWQWDYRGTPEERAELERSLGLSEEPTVSAEQEELF